jgi:DUF1680 family protein
MAMRSGTWQSVVIAVMLTAAYGGTAMNEAATGPEASAVAAVKPALEPFDLSRVRLLDGPALRAQEANRRYLRELDSDRLLYTFRVNAGLPAPGQPLGGWEAPTVEVRGHFLGHYLSACAMTYASTGDEQLKAKADAIVAELATCQQALGGEYLSAFSEDFWDRLESMQNPPWAPYYVIHKIMAGLFDTYTYCGNEQALEVLKRMAAYFGKRIDRLPASQMDQVLTIEFGGMSEVLHNLYAVTGDPQHLRWAHAFDRASFLGPLALEHDNLTRIHANTHIPVVCGAARHYELTGDERYRTAALYFWDRVVNTRSYATAGSNRGEHWGEPGKLARTLGADNQESCTTYNMLKLTRYLMRWTADPVYGDYYERAYLNGILGTQDLETGMLVYFMPLGTGFVKQFGTPYDSFWCCYGTGIESFAKLGDSIYFHDDDGLYVNLFVASAVEWPEKGLRLEQVTRFPEDDSTTLVFHTNRPVSTALKVRVPHWAMRGVTVQVNGKPVDVRAKPSSYLSINRTWRNGDTVEVRIPMALHAHPMPDDPEMAAIMYGPLVLAGLIDRDRFFLGDIDDLASWIKPAPGEALTFRTAGQPADVTFVPLNRVMREQYGVYWVITKEGSPRHREILVAEEAHKAREARIVDRVTPVDAANEAAHNLQGKDTMSGAFAGRSWRHATSGGWWSWDLKVLPDAAMTLACTYWGDDVPPRTFDVLVEGQVIATQSLNRSKPGEFFEVEYPLPPDLTRGKDRVTVRFNPHEGNIAGGVFECVTFK